MSFLFFGDADQAKSSSKSPSTTNEKSKSTTIPTGSFIVFSASETVERVGDKEKGQLSGATVKVGSMSKG